MTPLEALLEDRYDRYCRPDFIADDPISIPHRFSAQEDREIAGFLTATLAWGNRKVILTSAGRLMRLMDDAPAAFVRHASDAELKHLDGFVHRTFNGVDAGFFVRALRCIYLEHGGLEGVFRIPDDAADVGPGLTNLRRLFLPDAPLRTQKHMADVARGSAAKRLNMFLRWMARPCARGVDFGLWGSPSPRQLLCPLDVHVGKTARALGLLGRRQNDWRAVQELTAALRAFDPADPVRFDFALFGLGVCERWQA